MIKQIFRTFTSIMLVVIMVSIGVNIIKQFITIKEAKDKNSNLSAEIANLEKDNRDFLRKIEYSTSSAFLEQQTRITLGMGTNDDYWIESDIDDNIDLYPKIEEDKNETIWTKWIKLFTH